MRCYMKQKSAFTFYNRLIIIAVIFFLALPAMGQVSVRISETKVSHEGQEYYLHTVEPQQTLYGISQAYNISIEAIKQANPDTESGIQVHQVLRIPTSATTPAPSSPAPKVSVVTTKADEIEYKYHVAQKGESFAAVAAIFKVDEQVVRAANPSRGEPFQEGDYILVPLVPQQDEGIQSKIEPVEQPTQTETAPKLKLETTAKPETPIVVEEIKETESKTTKTQVVTQSETVVDASFTADSLKYHIIEKGQTVYFLSRTYGVSIAEIKRVNPELTESLSIGQRVLIPSSKQHEKGFILHTVEKEQRSKNLAQDFDIRIEELQQANPAMGKYVFPNQLIKIPIKETEVQKSSVQLVTTEPEEQKKEVKASVVLEETPTKTEEQETEFDLEESEELVLQSECNPDENASEKTYNIAIMLPLYLDQFKGISDIAEGRNKASTYKNLSFVPFYRGFIMAADSLTKHHGLKLDISVYDIDQNNQKLQNAINDPKLKEADLIIGPFFSQAFDKMASFAKENQIPIVNPMSQRSEFLSGNPYVIKVKPSMESMFEQIAQTIAYQYPDAKVFLYQANNIKDQRENAAIELALNKHIPQQVNLSNHSVYNYFKQHSAGRSNKSRSIRSEGGYININDYELSPSAYSSFDNTLVKLSFDKDDVKSFSRAASAIRDNVVVIYSEDRVFAMDFVNKLNQIADTIPIKLVTLPDWSRFDNLFIENLMRLNAHYIAPSHIDYSNYKTEYFIHNYRIRYSTEPDNYAFEGFDIGWYFLSALQKFGDGFKDCLPSYPKKMLQACYRLNVDKAGDGIENQQWSVYKHDNYRLISVFDD